jgi:hypothetical protein
MTTLNEIASTGPIGHSDLALAVGVVAEALWWAPLADEGGTLTQPAADATDR